jgi:hypothetical protein
MQNVRGFRVAIALAFAGYSFTLNAASTVTPSAFETSEGGGNSLAVLNGGGRTNQFQWTSTALSGLPVGATITGMRFRLDGGGAAAPASMLNWTDYEVTLAKASNAIGSMSGTLTNNMTNPVQVMDGALSISTNSFPGTGTPRSFGPLFAFDTNYLYTGNDLVMLLTHNGSGGSNITVDATTTTATGTGGYRALSTPAGFQGTVADNPTWSLPIIQFDYVMPEIAVRGNGNDVADGATTTSISNNTDFGDRVQNSVASVQFEIINSGGGTLTLSQPIFTGPFSLNGSFPTTVAPNSSAFFSVLMSTVNNGSFTGSISFANTDADETPFNFGLSGSVPEPTSLMLFALSPLLLRRRRAPIR